MANRYTQLTASEFNPLSLQELSLAPAMMRQQHDQAAAQQEALRLELNAYSNPLAQHREEAMALQNTMNSTIDNQATSLAEEGYNRNSGIAMSKLNREFRNLTSPTGRLGQINAARDAYFKNREEFMKSSDAQTWGREDAERNWAIHASKYSGYDESGNISQIGTLGAAEKYRVMDFMEKGRHLVGNFKRRLDSIRGGSIRQRPDGNGYEIINSSGQVMQDTNLEQLNQLRAAAKVEFLTPGMRGYESAKFEGMTPQQVDAQIDLMINSMLKDEITDTRNTSISLTAAKNPIDLANERSFSMIDGVTQSRTLGPEFESVKSLNDFLNSGKPKNDAELAKYETAKHMLSRSKAYAQQDPTYKTASKVLSEANKKAGLPDSFNINDITVKPKDKGGMDSIWDFFNFNSAVSNNQAQNFDYFYQGKPITKEQYQKYASTYKLNSDKLKTVHDDLTAIENQYLERSMQRQYQTIQPNTPQAENLIKQDEKNLYNFLTSTDALVNGAVKVESVHSSTDKSGTKIVKKPEELNKELSKVLRNVKPEDVTARNTFIGDDGKLYLQVSMKTDNTSKNSANHSINGLDVDKGGTLTLTLEANSTKGDLLGNVMTNSFRRNTASNVQGTYSDVPYGMDGYNSNVNMSQAYNQRLQESAMGDTKWGSAGATYKDIQKNDNLRQRAAEIYESVKGEAPKTYGQLEEFYNTTLKGKFSVGTNTK